MTAVRAATPADDIAEVLVDEKAISEKVRELGDRIAADYRGKDLVLVSILKGALPFLADLMRNIPIPLRLDFLEVLVVEDILDTGHTLAFVLEHLRSQRPDSLRLCTLLDKPARRIVPITIDYRGFEIPDKFVVGYGLDYAERYRNLPFIGVLKPEVYRSTT